MRVLKEEGKTALFVTHNKEELAICDVVYSIENREIKKKINYFNFRATSTSL